MLNVNIGDIIIFCIFGTQYLNRLEILQIDKITYEDLNRISIMCEKSLILEIDELLQNNIDNYSLNEHDIAITLDPSDEENVFQITERHKIIEIIQEITNDIITNIKKNTNKLIEQKIIPKREWINKKQSIHDIICFYKSSDLNNNDYILYRSAFSIYRGSISKIDITKKNKIFKTQYNIMFKLNRENIEPCKTGEMKNIHEEDILTQENIEEYINKMELILKEKEEKITKLIEDLDKLILTDKIKQF